MAKYNVKRVHDCQKIKRLGSDVKGGLKGKRLIVYKLITKNGMTVATIRAAATIRFRNDPTWNNGRTTNTLRYLAQRGIIKLK